MKKIMIAALAITLLVPAMASADTLTIRFGYFLPKAGQNYPDSLWAIEFDQMSFKKSNFNEAMLGIGYERFLSKQLSLCLSVDTYNKTKLGIYNDYVGYSFDEGEFAFPYEYYVGDYDIDHSFGVSITPIQLSLKLAPGGRRTWLVPYVGGGVGLYIYSASLRGLVIDFSDPWIYDDEDLGEVDIFPVFQSYVRETRVAFGYHAFGGFMIPIGSRMTIDLEARYNFAKGSFKDDFQDFGTFDLSGPVFSAGINYWF
ncbi:MAG TPA: hypothetical protein PLX50_07625 [Candidatus Aminicenantes bacterium]|nr:hypothetical protein [Acidobacteriota bacterium]HOI45465.1 hypothetical protein [Candidatus Aminicenantes bacterium]